MKGSLNKSNHQKSCPHNIQRIRFRPLKPFISIFIRVILSLNQLIYLPKGISLHQYSDDYLKTATYLINRIYRECLDGLSAEECFLLTYHPD